MHSATIEGFRLSPQQAHLWPLSHDRAFRALGVVSVTGALDLEILRQAARAVAERHEILRTTYQILPGMTVPLQVIHPVLEPEVAERDLTGLGPLELQARIDALQREALERPFDLARGPLFRLTLGRLNSRSGLLWISLPALCADRAGLRRLVAELGALCAGGTLEALGDPAQYADCAEAFLGLLESEETEEGREHWRAQGIAGRVADPEESFEPAVVSAVLPADLLARAGRALGTEATPEALLLAAWKALLWRLSGRTDALLGAVCGGRTWEGLDTALGLFERTVPVLAGVTGRESFAELVERAGRELAGLERRQDYFSWDLAGGGELAFAPFAFAWVAPLREADGFTVLEERVCGERCEARLVGRVAEHAVTLELEHDGALHGREEMELWLERLVHLLEDALSRLQAPLDDLELVGERERGELERWNATAVELPSGRGLHRLFEAQVARTPDRPAVRFAGEELSFAELNGRANRLARHLRALGVATEIVVGICAERSLDLVVGILGTLKAGGAYLPLEPSYPRERLAFLLADAVPAVLLTQDRLAGSLPDHPARVVRLDADAPAIAARSRADLPGEASGEALAYVIYTSGSTGRPKGVMISHRGIANRLLWMGRAFPLRRDDRVLLKTPFSFDASIWELFAPLLEGACLVVAEPRGHQDPAYLTAVVREEGITVLQMVPSLLQTFLEQPDVEACASLRRVFSGGEALPAGLARLCQERLSAELVNLYGPTESSIDASFAPCLRGADPGTGTMPIGRPLDNLRIHLLEPGLRLAPLGSAAELHIGGAGLARGYRGRPDLTAERFLPDPFGPEPGGRLYATGDLARWRPAGHLEYLGRLDHQVKVRGVRIELGEIEATLRRHSRVARAVVAAREDGPGGGTRLVAYVVAVGEEPPDEADLRSFLQQSLPELMMPAALVALPELPLLPNGKLDRAALPAPEEVRRRGADRFDAPRTPTEQLLASIWTDLLGVERIGLHDSFFDLGGHSLVATRLMSRLRVAFELDLPLRSLFERPTLAMLAQAVDEARRGAAAPAPLLRRLPDEAAPPLAFSQQRLWFIDQMEPGSPLYNLPMAVRFRGRLDRELLRRALGVVVARHEPLRTRFGVRDGETVQIVEPAREPEAPLVDLTGLVPEAGEAEARRLGAAEALRPFDLGRGPLLRLLLLRLAEDEHLALLSVHHIVSDAWSTGLLVRELGEIYRALAAGQTPSLPELPVRYRDYAAWQREWLRGEALDRLVSFWSGALHGAPELIELPTDRPRPAVQGTRGRRCELPVPPETAASLRDLGRREGATLFMTLLAVWQTLLARISDQGDVCVGTPVAGRNRVEVEGLIGLFVNTLVMRADLSDDPTFAELLARVRRFTLEAHDHQDLPFERLVDELRPRRTLSHTPLFQTMLVLQNAPFQALELPGLTLTPLASDPGTAKFDLTLMFEESAGGLTGLLESSVDLFDAATAGRLVSHVQVLLESAAARPGEPVSALPLLGPAERSQILALGGTPLPAAEPACCLHRRFERVAAAGPEGLAVTCEGRHLTYRELNRQANQLARHLRALGAGPEARIGLCLDRSPDLVVAILGVLKAGAAYVPLDPAHPGERIAFTLADAGAPVVVTRAGLLETLPGSVAAVCLDADAGAIARREDGDLPGGENPASAAYVIYTSGSTGTPKGVVVQHDHVDRLFTSTRSWLGFDETDVWTLFHSPTFDFSVWELWGALLHGGRLVVPSHWVTRSPETFRELLGRERVTVLNQTPSAFRQLVRADAAAQRDDLRLRLIVFGGEALDPGMLAPWIERHGDRRPRLVNMYGITETTVHVTYRSITAEDLGAGARSPIGMPIPDLQVHLLDSRLEPVPLGVRGEIYVGGDGLARGYLGRAGLTASRFVPDLFAREPGARLYRSGDQARRLPDGSLEYLGRIDYQVKVRGFRIELGEIEAVLGSHPDVREAVVLARGTGEETRLVAYVVPRGAAGARAGELRAFLSARLPDYMLPSSFVELARLPLTANGKLDRSALPEPASDRPDLGRGAAAPRTGREELLAAIWKSVLRLEEVGIHDDFFGLGGDSILSLQVVARAAEAGYRLTPKQIFQAPTIAELAGQMVAAGDSDAEQGPVTGPVPLTPIQRWFFAGEPAEPHHWNQAVLLQVPRDLDLEAIDAAMAALTLHHDTLRLRFRRGPSGWEQQAAAPAAADAPRIERLDLSELPDDERREALLRSAEELQATLDLSAGPLLRLAFFDLGAGRPARLLLIVHHLAIDGVSWRILLEDLQAVYRQLQAGGPVQLPAKTTSYKRWAERLEELVTTGALLSELPFWTAWAEAAANAGPRVAPQRLAWNTEASARMVSVRLGEDETRDLLQEMPRTWRTRVDEVLLTALARALSQLTEGGPLQVDLEGHGREELSGDVDLSRTVGWFTAIYPVLLEADPTEPAVASLKRIKETLRRIPGRGIGFGLLRDLVALPPAAVSFNYLGQIDGSFEHGFRMAPEPVGGTHSPRSLRRHALDVVAVVAGGRLRIDWTYSERLQARSEVELLAHRFLVELRALIADGRRPDEGTFTPSDFPEMDFDQRELDELLGDLETVSERP